MKITGYRLREAIQGLELQRQTAAAQFPDTLLVFPGHEKPSPKSVLDKVEEYELKLCTLQTVQGVYNQMVQVDIGQQRTSLASAVKMKGALERTAKLWRIAATGKRDKYARYRSDAPDRIKSDEVMAVKAVAPEVAAQEVARLMKDIGRVKEAIAIGNATSVELDAKGLGELLA